MRIGCVAQKAQVAKNRRKYGASEAAALFYVQSRV
jgi:hypothetical protein